MIKIDILQPNNCTVFLYADMEEARAQIDVLLAAINGPNNDEPFSVWSRAGLLRLRRSALLGYTVWDMEAGHELNEQYQVAVAVREKHTDKATEEALKKLDNTAGFGR